MKRFTLAAVALVVFASAVPGSMTLQKYHVSPKDLPAPDPASSVRNGPKLMLEPPMGAKVALPPGFEAKVFAEGGFQRPRGIAGASNGDVFVTDSDAGTLIVLRDTNGDGAAEERGVFAAGLTRPFGIAFWRDYVYVGNTDAIVRFKYRPGQMKAEGDAEKIAELPSAKTGHWTRNLAFSPDGKKFYVTVGSGSNADIDTDPMRGTIVEFNPDGTGKRVFATGTRNAVGLAFHPKSKKLWAAVQERDFLGDGLVPDYVTEVKDGGFYGFPYAYVGPNEDPTHKGKRPDLVKQTIVPDVLLLAHSAVLGAAFYTGNAFPKEYQGDLFLALHGSSNRSKRIGYSIVRVPFKGGKRASEGYEDFLTGWMLSEDKPEVWGRPVGVAVTKDGSLVITDDGAKKVWRVAYSKGSSPSRSTGSGSPTLQGRGPGSGSPTLQGRGPRYGKGME